MQATIFPGSLPRIMLLPCRNRQIHPSAPIKSGGIQTPVRTHIYSSAGKMKVMEKNGLGFLLLLLLLVLCATVAADDGRDARPGPRAPPPPPRAPPPPGRRAVRCRLREFPCFGVSLFCPLECPRKCLMDCTLCKPVCNCNRPGAVCQDPRFVGGDGITFYFHGHKDRDFCLVTDPGLHINAHFIGKRNPGMKRDFTWVQSLGILFDSHKLFIGAKKTAAWDDSSDRLALAFDGEAIPLPPGEGITWQSAISPRVSISRTRATNGVAAVAEGRFVITAEVVPITEEDSRVHRYNITSDDCFAHLDLGFKFYDLSDGVDGVLGQTYRKNYTSRVKMGIAMPVLGGDREFSSSHLFATDCAASRFTAAVVNGGRGH